MSSPENDGSGGSEVPYEGEKSRAGRVPRRARRPAVPGTDPSPEEPNDTARGEGENDDRLRADKPPHWG